MGAAGLLKRLLTVVGERGLPEGADAEGHLRDRRGLFRVRTSAVARMREAMALVNEVVCAFDRSFSAEHGMGQLKAYMMPGWRSGAELDAMRRVKRALDPAEPMNPGKIFLADHSPASQPDQLEREQLGIAPERQAG